MSAASHYNRSYFFDPAFDGLPAEIKKDVRILTTVAAERTRGIVCVGFQTADCRPFIESSKIETDENYDEIHARAIIDQTAEENEELLASLSKWYELFMTEDGKLYVAYTKQAERR
jgi:hypothetical protein